MELAAKVFEQVDVIVAPTFSTQLLITNLTGHPAIILPNGFRGDDAPKAHVRENGEVEGGGPGTPLSLTFLGSFTVKPKCWRWQKPIRTRRISIASTRSLKWN